MCQSSYPESYINSPKPVILAQSRSETHHPPRGPAMRFARAQPILQRSNPAIPEVVVTLDVHRQEGTVAAPAFVFGQLDCHGVLIVLARIHRLLHGGGE